MIAEQYTLPNLDSKPTRWNKNKWIKKMGTCPYLDKILMNSAVANILMYKSDNDKVV